LFEGMALCSAVREKTKLKTEGRARIYDL